MRTLLVFAALLVAPKATYGQHRAAYMHLGVGMGYSEASNGDGQALSEVSAFAVSLVCDLGGYVGSRTAVQLTLAAIDVPEPSMVVDGTRMSMDGRNFNLSFFGFGVLHDFTDHLFAHASGGLSVADRFTTNHKLDAGLGLIAGLGIVLIPDLFLDATLTWMDFGQIGRASEGSFVSTTYQLGMTVRF